MRSGSMRIGSSARLARSSAEPSKMALAPALEQPSHNRSDEQNSETDEARHCRVRFEPVKAPGAAPGWRARTERSREEPRGRNRPAAASRIACAESPALDTQTRATLDERRLDANGWVERCKLLAVGRAVSPTVHRRRQLPKRSRGMHVGLRASVASRRRHRHPQARPRQHATASTSALTCAEILPPRLSAQASVFSMGSPCM